MKTKPQQTDLVTEARELAPYVQGVADSTGGGKLSLVPELLRQLADEVERLRRQQEKVIQLIETKRDGGTARYAYGGYSRELWHLNVETLKTVCKELLKEVADALAFNTASNPVGSRADLDAGAVHKAEGVDHD